MGGEQARLGDVRRAGGVGGTRGRRCCRCRCGCGHLVDQECGGSRQSGDSCPRAPLVPVSGGGGGLELVQEGRRRLGTVRRVLGQGPVEEIGDRVGKNLNNKNWVHTVDHYGKIRDYGAGQYASLHTGKYDDNDTFRLEEFDSKLGPQGEFKALTKLEDVPAS